jgi:hypothetical protein
MRETHRANGFQRYTTRAGLVPGRTANSGQEDPRSDIRARGVALPYHPNRGPWVQPRGSATRVATSHPRTH